MAASTCRCFLASETFKPLTRLLICDRNGWHIKKCLSTETNVTNTVEEAKGLPNQDDTSKPSKPSKLEKLRDVSRLAPRLKTRVRKLPTYIHKDYMTTKKFAGREYGRLGNASGVNPQVLWPTVQELQKKIEFEKEFEKTFEERMEKVVLWRTRREEKLAKKIEKVDKAMAKMPKLIAAFKGINEKEVIEAEIRKQKYELYTREAIELYGPMQKKDPRLTKYINDKLRAETASKKEAKTAKKTKEKGEKIEKVVKEESENVMKEGNENVMKGEGENIKKEVDSIETSKENS